jgi:hypothetical protein
MQSEIPAAFEKEDRGWLKWNTDSRKTASIFTLQEHMVETKTWKEMRGLVDQNKWGKKLAGLEYVRRHDNTMKVMAVQ